MIVSSLPYIIYRSYPNFGYLTDNRNYGYDTASHSCLKVGDLLLSKTGNVFYSVLSPSSQDIDALVNKLCQLFPGISSALIREDAINFYTDLHVRGFVFVETDNNHYDRQFNYFSYDNWQTFELKLPQEQDNKSIYEETFGTTRQLSRVHVDISGLCNENCIHCYVPNKYKHGTMPKDLFEEIFTQCEKMNVFNITISGGEPMLNPDLKYFLQLCEKHNFSVNVLSNLTLLSDELLDIFVANPLLSIQTSLYAMVEEVHDSITRSNGSFKKTMNSIKLLHKWNIPMQINCPIMKQNMPYYKDVLNFAQSMNIEADSDYSLFGSYDLSKSNLSCRLSIPEIKKIVLEEDNLSKIKDSNSAGKDELTPICPVCKSSLCISNSGNIYPCEGWQSLSLGNIKQQNLQDVWEKSTQVKQLRELTYGDFFKCNSCLNKYYCTPCLIMNANESEEGNYFSVNQFTCEIAKIKKNAKFLLCNKDSMDIG